MCFVLRFNSSTLIFPSVFFDHVSQLDDVLALLVLLARLVGLLVLPSESGLAAITIDVGYSVETGEKDPLLGLATTDVDDRVEEVGPALAALERFRDELVVVGEVGPAVDARVGAVTHRKVSPKGLR
jgi:hypothetical protein